MCFPFLSTENKTLHKVHKLTDLSALIYFAFALFGNQRKRFFLELPKKRNLVCFDALPTNGISTKVGLCTFCKKIETKTLFFDSDKPKATFQRNFHSSLLMLEQKKAWFLAKVNLK
jgi:hypothetical protein